jgi:hypothetical protein
MRLLYLGGGEGERCVEFIGDRGVAWYGRHRRGGTFGRGCAWVGGGGVGGRGLAKVKRRAHACAASIGERRQRWEACVQSSREPHRRRQLGKATRLVPSRVEVPAVCLYVRVVVEERGA